MDIGATGIWMIIVIVCYAISYREYREADDVFNPVTLLTAGVFLFVLLPNVFRIIFEYPLRSLDYLHLSERRQLVGRSLTLILLSILSWYIGYRYGPSKVLVRHLPYPKASWRGGTWPLVSLIGILCVSFLFGIWAIATSGFQSLSGGRGEAVHGVKGIFGISLFLWTPVWLLGNIGVSLRLNSRIAYWTLGVLCAAIIAVSGSRGAAGSCIVAHWIAYHYIWDKQDLSKVIIGGVILSMVAVMSEAGSRENIWLGMYSSITPDIVDSLAAVLRTVPQETSYMLGTTWISDLVQDFRLSGLFGETGTSTRDWFMNNFYPEYDPSVVSVPISKIGEFYLQFGIGGVVVGTGMLGVGSAVVYRYFRRWPKPVIAYLYVIILLFGGMVQLGGWFMAWTVRRLLTIGGAIGLVILLTKGRFVTWKSPYRDQS